MAHILLLDDDTGFTPGHPGHFGTSGTYSSMRSDPQKKPDNLLWGPVLTFAILDLMLPDGSGLQIMESLNSLKHAGHIAIVTGTL